MVPDVGCLIIISIDRNVEAIEIQTHVYGQKIPGVGDRLFFKIITKRKITEHFKKSVMSSGATDIFEIVVFTPGSNTFL